MIKTVHCRRANFCSYDCVQRFTESRNSGELYPQFCEKNGNILDIEKASIKYRFCVYCQKEIKTIKEQVDDLFRKEADEKNRRTETSLR